MGRVPQDYPDITAAVMYLIREWYPADFATRPDHDYRVARVFPPDIQSKLPFCRVTDIGGNDDGLTDRPLIDIDILAPTFARARDLSRGIQSHLLGYPWRAGSTVIDKVRTAMRPHDVPWDDDNVFRFYSSYTISARR